jgi:anion-transporting  ArsA/GET3 family ATPase
LAEFVAELNELFGGFRERAAKVSLAFRAPSLAYVLVTSAAPAAIDEIGFFAARLGQQGMHANAVVVNRLQPSPPETRAEGFARDLSPAVRDAVLRAAADERTRAAFEADQLRVLDRVLGSPRPEVLRVPVMDRDVHDVRGLSAVSARLFPA